MKKSSLLSRLIILFCITSMLPISVLGFFSYYSSKSAIRENTQALGDINVKQMDDNLRIQFDSYESVLFQIYTADDIVNWVENLNAGRDEAVTVNQLRRYLQGILNSRKYIRAITVITQGGLAVSYDQMTPTTYENSWMDQYSTGKDDLYDEIMANSDIHIYPTEYATNFANQDYYLFHMAHRIIDYKDINKKIGAVILSLDAQLLEQICLENGNDDDTISNFIVDSNGQIIYYKDFSKIGTRLWSDTNETDREKIYREFIENDQNYTQNHALVSFCTDESLGWDIIGVSNQDQLLRTIRHRLWVIVLISFLLLVLAIGAMINISGNLVRSVQSIVAAMKKTENGDIKNHVEVTKEMPIEIEDIVVAFNDMLEKLDMALEKEKEAIGLKKDAEIKALEAQINPHFLYNTLDMINWMAINQNAYDISNAIGALAHILRYAISESNRETTVAREAEWLRKYVYLQQVRLREGFSCDIQVDEDAKVCKIHKLLLQPFVENSILHGFKNLKEKHILNISIEKKDRLVITIEDNGVGIPDETLNELKEKRWKTSDEKYHIGIQNAIMRLEMYYGNDADIDISSIVNMGTTVVIRIPVQIENLILENSPF